MLATADTAMGGGFRRNTVSKLKHTWETQTQKQLNKNHCIIAGEFTATIAGTYMFNMYVRSTGADSGAINIKKNDASICNAWVSQGSGWDISSCSAVTHLISGDKVKVTGGNNYPAQITASHNGFNGILIYAD